VRTIMADAAKNGLPGDHHFYISFDTRAEGVEMSPRLRAQYPEEITIILQHQFWDLAVTEENFSVGMSFGGVPEKLTVPFDAIKGFFDPSVQFGLQFETILTQSEDGAPVAAENNAETKIGAAPRPLPDPANPEAAEAKGEKPAGADIVRFDRFRKK